MKKFIKIALPIILATTALSHIIKKYNAKKYNAKKLSNEEK